jgi:hypothetical protein
VVGDRDNRIVEGGENVGDTGGDVFRTLGLTNLDRADFLFEEFFSRGLTSDTTDELDWGSLSFGRGRGGCSRRGFGGGRSSVSRGSGLRGLCFRGLGGLGFASGCSSLDGFSFLGADFSSAM